MAYLTFAEYDSHEDNKEKLTQTLFDKLIFDVEMAIDDFTFTRLKNDNFFAQLSPFQLKLLKKAMVKTLEWWFKREEFINSYGAFTSFSVGSFDVEIPDSYQNDPKAFLQSIQVPVIAQRYLERAGLRYPGANARNFY